MQGRPMYLILVAHTPYSVHIIRLHIRSTSSQVPYISAPLSSILLPFDLSSKYQSLVERSKRWSKAQHHRRSLPFTLSNRWRGSGSPDHAGLICSEYIIPPLTCRTLTWHIRIEQDRTITSGMRGRQPLIHRVPC